MPLAMIANNAYKQGPVIYAMGTFLKQINNPTPAATENFGNNLAATDSYLYVGVPAEYGYSGKVYVYSTTGYGLLYTITNPNAYGTTASDNFGTSIACSGNYFAVSAPMEMDAQATTHSSGKVYIFSVTTGNLLYTIDNPNPGGGNTNGDWFGTKLTASGNYLAAYNMVESETGMDQFGKVFIYNITTGALVTSINNPAGINNSDHFGSSMCADGTNLAITNKSGTLYIFNITNGSLIRTITYPGVQLANLVVSIDGNYVAVGSMRETDSAGNLSSGKVFVLSVSNGTLLWTFENPSSSGTGASDFFGQSVQVAGNLLIVGCSNEDLGGSASGTTYVYNLTTGALVKTIQNPNKFGATTGDMFGYYVTANSTHFMVSAVNEDDTSIADSGKVYVFALGV